MNDRTQNTVIRWLGVAGSSVAAVAVISLFHTESIVKTLLLASLAGTLGYGVFTLLGMAIFHLRKRWMLARPGDTVYAFASLPPEEETAAGGKGRVLAKLYRMDFPVPDGCILLPGAFTGDEISDEAWEKVKKQCSRLRRGKQVAFAVRSSAQSEDSAQASFAGEFESVLGVRTDAEIRDAIRVVLQSRHSARVQSYSQAQGLGHAYHPIAVIIQVFIQADYSGVLFTVDPLTGSQMQMTGNFVSGTGEKLVSGQVSASAFTLARPEGIYEGPAGLKPFAGALHDEAHAIEHQLGSPQDIEWAVAGGKLYILQARPITTLNGYNPITADWNDTLRGCFLWSATNLMEAQPEVLTPFTASLRTYLDQHGGPTLTVNHYPLNGIICGRFYVNISVQVSAFVRAFKGDTHRAYRELAGWWGEIPETMDIPLLPLTDQEWKREILPDMWRTTRMFGKYRRQTPQFLAQNRRRCAELREKIRNETTGIGLLGLWQREISPHYCDSVVYIVSASSDVQVRVERELCSLVGPQEANALLSNLGGLSTRLESLGPVAGLGMVLRGEMSREDYLDAYGHRGVNEGECAWPRPAEDPDWLDKQLEEMKRAPVEVETLLGRQRAEYDAAWARFCQQHPGKIKKIQKRIRQAASAAQQRELVRSEATRGVTVLRAFALRAGELLGIGEDVFYLTIDEVQHALAGETSAFQHIAIRLETYRRYRALPPYPSVICGRFDPFAWAAGPQRHSGIFDSRVQAPPLEDQGASLIKGFPGALGVVEGTVRRLDHVSDSDRFQAGEVLVTAMTNIGWTPLFPRAAAIVTDLGAPLSHAAIVARELGIPAVVGCGNATQRLKTGDRVRVDGGRGLVEILSQE